jgi:AhpD family alkylhydroperoxidase
MSRVQEFTEYRQRMNARIHETGTTTTKRFFALDERCYEAGALDRKTKELAGLSASMVLRCDDCISYHVAQAVEVGCTRDEIMEIFDVGLIVGGSIVIPHLRRAIEFLDELTEGN